MAICYVLLAAIGTISAFTFKSERQRHAGLLVARQTVEVKPDMASNPESARGVNGRPSGISKIKHIIIIMQENRSFDSYFGTYLGADGIPMSGGVPKVCVPDPRNGGCQRPYHDSRDVNYGGPHSAQSAIADINGGRMDGFIEEAEHAENDLGNSRRPITMRPIFYRPSMWRARASGRYGLPRPARDSPLLDLCPEFRASRSHV